MGNLFTPKKWQVAPFADKSPVVLLTGSAGGGKSRIAAEKIHAFCLKYPGATAVVMRKTRESMKGSTIDFLERVVIGKDPRVRKKLSEHRFDYENGSAILWGGMKDENQREQIRSIGLEGGVDIVWMEEATAFDEEDFDEMIPRMRGTAVERYYMSMGYTEEEARKRGWRQIILTTNPDHPYHWIKRRLIDGEEAVVYLSSYIDNDSNPDDYGDRLQNVRGVRYLRLVKGEWAQSQGMVYDEFSERLHLVEPFEIPSSWRRVVSIDFGFTHPFVALWGALDEDERLYIYRQIYMTQRLVSEHAVNIKRLSAGETIETFVCDWDAENRAQLSDAFKDVPVRAAIKAITGGIQAVKERLAVAGDGRPRLFFFKNSLVEEDHKIEYGTRQLLEEIYGYVWDENRASGRVKETPVKREDDAMDALRYMVTYVDPIAPVDVVSLGEIYRQDEQQYRRRRA